MQDSLFIPRKICQDFLRKKIRQAVPTGGSKFYSLLSEIRFLLDIQKRTCYINQKSDQVPGTFNVPGICKQREVLEEE